jgi:hypothetical protein
MVAPIGAMRIAATRVTADPVMVLRAGRIMVLLVGRAADRQAGRAAVLLVDRVADRQAGRVAVPLADRAADRQADRAVVLLADRAADRRAGRAEVLRPVRRRAVVPRALPLADRAVVPRPVRLRAEVLQAPRAPAVLRVDCRTAAVRLVIRRAWVAPADRLRDNPVDVLVRPRLADAPVERPVVLRPAVALAVRRPLAVVRVVRLAAILEWAVVPAAATPGSAGGRVERLAVARVELRPRLKRRLRRRRSSKLLDGRGSLKKSRGQRERLKEMNRPAAAHSSLANREGRARRGRPKRLES